MQRVGAQAEGIWGCMLWVPFPPCWRCMNTDSLGQCLPCSCFSLGQPPNKGLPKSCFCPSCEHSECAQHTRGCHRSLPTQEVCTPSGLTDQASIAQIRGQAVAQGYPVGKMGKSGSLLGQGVTTVSLPAATPSQHVWGHFTICAVLKSALCIQPHPALCTPGGGGLLSSSYAGLYPLDCARAHSSSTGLGSTREHSTEGNIDPLAGKVGGGIFLQKGKEKERGHRQV